MGDIYLYTGEGAGKTTNALGLALRMAGHGKKTVIIQFLKWWKDTGEYKIRNRLKGYYIYQFGRKGWKGLSNLGPKDRELCERGLEKAREELRKRKPNLLVLDELNLAVHCGMLDVKEVIRFLDSVPKATDVVITGRHAARELIKRAEYVNEVVMIKMPKKPASKAGIQY
ncbi:cob(I)alamin adenosyltransferase [sediment metagenome]|uniref:Cob(I)alamin adenosyltransferase n=1 Tax=sediment metagenome TaxID=749907 RepID=D9PKX4_9ZZZZ